MKPAFCIFLWLPLLSLSMSSCHERTSNWSNPAHDEAIKFLCDFDSNDEYAVLEYLFENKIGGGRCYLKFSLEKTAVGKWFKRYDAVREFKAGTDLHALEAANIKYRLEEVVDTSESQLLSWDFTKMSFKDEGIHSIAYIGPEGQEEVLVYMFVFFQDATIFKNRP